VATDAMVRVATMSGGFEQIVATNPALNACTSVWHCYWRVPQGNPDYMARWWGNGGATAATRHCTVSGSAPTTRWRGICFIRCIRRTAQSGAQPECMTATKRDILRMLMLCLAVHRDQVAGTSIRCIRRAAQQNVCIN
jgi:hypothetical protein